MQGQSAVLNAMTLPPGATSTQARLVFDGVRGAIFVYQNGGPVGALIGSWARLAGTDPYGNAYPQGLSVDVGSLNGTSLFLYDGTPALGNLILSIADTPGTDPFGNNYPAGMTVGTEASTQVQMVSNANDTGQITFLLNNPSFTQGAIFGAIPGSFGAIGIFGPANTAAGHTDSVAIGFDSSDGTDAAFGDLDYTTPSNSTLELLSWDGDFGISAFTLGGIGGQLPIVQTDTTTKTNANNAGQDITVGWTIPANDANVGTIYEIEFDYDGTFENQTLSFETSFDATPRAEVTIGSGFLAAGDTFNGTIRLKVQVTSTGATGTANFWLDGGFGILGTHSAGSNNNNAYLNARNTAEPFNTTIAHTFKGVSIWGGATAGQTVSGYGSKFTRYGP